MKNLRNLRLSKNLTQQELAELISVERTSIGKYEKHDVLPSKDILFRFADFFNVSIDYLLGRPENKEADFLNNPEISRIVSLYISSNLQGRDSALLVLERGQRKTSDKLSGEEVSVETFPFLISIPVVGRAAAGLPIEMIEQKDERISVDGVRYGDFAVVASGDSMIDAGINDGDRVIIRPQATVENGELALVAVEDGSTIKRFYVTDDGFKLVPANSQYETQYYPNDIDVRILGKVIKVINK